MTPIARTYLNMLHHLRNLYSHNAINSGALQNLIQTVADYQVALSGAEQGEVKLNLGSGEVVLKGFINVDIVPGPGVEVVDLTKPWPWADNSVDYVRASHVIEHLPDKILTMNELWRVLKPGAKVDIEVPTTEGTGAWQDPTHVSFWNRRSFVYYETASPYRDLAVKQYQVKAQFRVVREHMTQTIDGPILSITLEATKQQSLDTKTYDVVREGKPLVNAASRGMTSVQELTMQLPDNSAFSDTINRIFRSNENTAYLHLLKRTLSRYPLLPLERLMLWLLRDMEPALTSSIVRWALASSDPVNHIPSFKRLFRAVGMDWPVDGETMIGLHRLDNLEHCITSVLNRKIPGDLMETGVWRGGAAIFMRAVLKVYGDTERKVWLADSFQGLPKPDADTYPADRGDDLWKSSRLAVSLGDVKANFASYGLLDEGVEFLPGWFRDTLPNAPVERLSILRLDGDMYESTILALRSLYGKVSVGGFVIIDDYYYRPCREAVHDFRAAEGITDTIHPVDWTGVYWQVTRSEVPKEIKSIARRKLPQLSQT